jgi:hypothetical protein
MFLICCSNNELECFGVLAACYYKCFYVIAKSMRRVDFKLEKLLVSRDSTSFFFGFLFGASG